MTFELPEALRQRMTVDMVTLVRGMSASGTGLNVRKWREAEPILFQTAVSGRTARFLGDRQQLTVETGPTFRQS